MNTKEHVLIIAEAGVNHNGDIQMAFDLIDAAVAAGADIVKFQTFSAAKLVTKDAQQADYQVKNLGADDGQLLMLQKLELTREMHLKLIERCKERSIEFLSTPFDDASVTMLEELGMRIWKIPSGEITNYLYLKRIAALGKPIIVSTGMSNLGDVEAAIAVIENFGGNRNDITVLHCTTEYPAPIDEVNLRAMLTMKNAFGVDVGYSDHTEGIHVPIAAVAMGARVIEKHLTLDRTLPGPDHAASLEPKEFCEMVKGIRTIESALGNGIKKIAPSEVKNAGAARKSIVAARNIRAGEMIAADDLTVKRPGFGISPMRWNDVVGIIARCNFNEGDLIQL